MRTDPIRVIEVKILNSLNSASLPGGATGVSQGIGAPVANPSDETVTSLYVDQSTGILYYWNTTTLAWT